VYYSVERVFNALSNPIVFSNVFLIIQQVSGVFFSRRLSNIYTFPSTWSGNLVLTSIAKFPFLYPVKIPENPATFIALKTSVPFLLYIARYYILLMKSWLSKFLA